MEKIINIKKNSQYKRLIKNFISLFVLQGLNYLLPLVTIPYLTRVLGAPSYGLVLFATSTVMYFQIFTDYGFNLSATRRISINRENKEEVNNIFCSVLLIKSVFFLISCIIMFLMVNFISRFGQNASVFYVLMILVLGNVIFPVWLFQGMEEMKYIVYVNIAIKTLITAMIFIFVRSSSDFVILAFINSLASFLTGLVCLIIACKKFKLKLYIPNFSIMILDLKQGWHVFLTSMLSSVIINTGTFVLGIFTSDVIVGYYGGIDKIVKAFSSMFIPVTQAIFPYINSKFNDSYESGKKELIKFSKIILIVTLAICLGIILFNKTIVTILLGKDYLPYAHILQIMTIWIFFSILNNLVGVQYLIGTGYGKEYSKAFSLAAIITLIIMLIFVNFISFYAVVLATIIGEITLTISMFYIIKKRKKV